MSKKHVKFTKNTVAGWKVGVESWQKVNNTKVSSKVIVLFASTIH